MEYRILTIPELRSILKIYRVAIPNRSKKSDLLELLNQVDLDQQPARVKACIRKLFLNRVNPKAENLRSPRSGASDTKRSRQRKSTPVIHEEFFDVQLTPNLRSRSPSPNLRKSPIRIAPSRSRSPTPPARSLIRRPSTRVKTYQGRIRQPEITP